jgi:hypothetical protein
MAPVRKIVAVFIGAGLAYIARRAGVDLGDADVNEAAVILAGLVFGYFAKP